MQKALNLGGEFGRADPAEPMRPIPVHTVGVRYGLDLVAQARPVLDALLTEASGSTPVAALKIADAVSRRWLQRSRSPFLPEIEAVADRIKRPGAYFFNVHYEWGCTTLARPSKDGRTAVLFRILDWQTNGLGRHVVAARTTGPAGSWITLTWPGYTGALQAMAPGRFSAALNQAPMRSAIGSFYADWAANRLRVWRQPLLTPAHLLRHVMNEAPDFATARRWLAERPICAPAIFTLAGRTADETCVIEREEERAAVIDGNGMNGVCAANDWQALAAGPVLARGANNDARRACLQATAADARSSFAWLASPVLNVDTRLAMVADAGSGTLLAQGFERGRPATEMLELRCLIVLGASSDRAGRRNVLGAAD